GPQAAWAVRPSSGAAPSAHHEGGRRRARDSIPNTKRVPSPDEPMITKARIIPKETPRIAKALVVVNAMGNRVRAGRDLSDRLHALVVQDLGTAGGLTLDPGAGARLQRVVVGGSITRPSRQENGPRREGTCRGQLTLAHARG